MKTILLSVSICILFIFFNSCHSDKKKYLELSESQMRDIGFVINEHGIFFKSVVPEKDYLPYMKEMRGYINTKDEQGTRMTMSSPDKDFNKISGDNPDYFDSVNVINSDYYFVHIIELGGDSIYTSISKKTETIPILVRQAKYNFKIKKDVIVYMKASEGLKKKLNYIGNLDTYIVTLNEK